MPIAPLILAMLVNLLLSFRSSNIKKSLTLMSNISIFTTQEKSKLNMAKEEKSIHYCLIALNLNYALITQKHVL